MMMLVMMTMRVGAGAYVCMCVCVYVRMPIQVFERHPRLAIPNVRGCVGPSVELFSGSEPTVDSSNLPPTALSLAPMPQLTSAEQNLVDSITRAQKSRAPTHGAL